jgi:hypothetical protein
MGPLGALAHTGREMRPVWAASCFYDGLASREPLGRVAGEGHSFVCAFEKYEGAA